MKKNLAIVLTGLLALVAVTENAHAWTHLRCKLANTGSSGGRGPRAKWEGNVRLLGIDDPLTTFDGEDLWPYLKHLARRWGNTRGTKWQINTERHTSPYSLNDDKNSMFLLDLQAASSVDAYNSRYGNEMGVTPVRMKRCSATDPRSDTVRIIEADVILDDDANGNLWEIDTGLPVAPLLSPQFFASVSHELGHFAALWHEDEGMKIMSTSTYQTDQDWAFGHSGSSWTYNFAPGPDERDALADIYKDTEEARIPDMLVANWFDNLSLVTDEYIRNGGIDIAALTDFSGTVYSKPTSGGSNDPFPVICPAPDKGPTIVSVGICNRWHLQSTGTARLRLSSNQTITDGDLDIGNRGYLLNGGHGCESFNIEVDKQKLSGLLNGEYYLGVTVGVISNNSTGERELDTENNAVLHNVGKVRISCE